MASIIQHERISIAFDPEALRRIQRDLSAKRPIKFYSKGSYVRWINSNAGDYRDRALTVKHFLVLRKQSDDL